MWIVVRQGVPHDRILKIEDFSVPNLDVIFYYLSITNNNTLFKVYTRMDTRLCDRMGNISRSVIPSLKSWLSSVPNLGVIFYYLLITNNNTLFKVYTRMDTRLCNRMGNISRSVIPSSKSWLSVSLLSVEPSRKKIIPNSIPIFT